MTILKFCDEIARVKEFGRPKIAVLGSMDHTELVAEATVTSASVGWKQVFGGGRDSLMGIDLYTDPTKERGITFGF